MKILKAIWQFCSYVYVPQWGRKRCKMSERRHIDKPVTDLSVENNSSSVRFDNRRTLIVTWPIVGF